MNIGIIGAGKVGTGIAKYLKINNCNISGFFSRNIESALESAKFVQTKAFENIYDLVSVSDIIFIAVVDDNIKDVWNSIKQNAEGKIVCHFSGVYSSKIFEEQDELKVKCCSVHPMYAFCDKYESYKKLNTANFVMEGNEEAINVMRSLFNNEDNNLYVIAADNKIKYHAAAAIASNHMIALYKQSMNLLAECGFDDISSNEILKPLVAENIDNLLANGCENALTGPIIRNDVNTVSMHLDCLKNNCDSDEIYDTYLSTAATLINIAQNKNPDNKYETISKLIMKK